MRRRRRRNRAAELTPLIDVLFIVLFASLLQARTTVEHSTTTADNTATATEASPYDAAGPDTSDTSATSDASDTGDASPYDAGDASVQDAGTDATIDAGPSEHLVQSREIAARLAGAVDNRDVFVVEVNEEGYVTTMARWQGGQEVRRDRVRHRLVRPVLPGESEQELMDVGRTDVAMRVCPLVRDSFEHTAGDDDPFIVLVVLDTPLIELPLALYRGLTADLKACFAEAAGVGILLQPGDNDHGIP